MTQETQAVHWDSPTIFHNEAFFSNPYPTYQEINAKGDIHRINILGGLWYVGTYDGILKYINDSRLSHNVSRYWAGQFSKEQLDELKDFIRLFGLWLAHYDGQEHTKYRSIMNKAFGAVLKEIRPQVQAIVDELVDRVAANGHMDLIRDFGYPLPLRIIMQMLGVPLEDMQLVIDCADSLVELFGATQADFELALRTQKHLVLMTEYLQGLIAERKVNPGNDVISLMLHSVDESGFQMSEDDVHGQCAMLLFAGHETTRNLVGNGVLALMQHPEQLQQLKENPALMRVAVQEILRYNSPVQMTMRAVTEDMEMFGQPVKKGQLVMFNYGAANHDPNHFQAPERFDIHRSESRHMSFGVGAHACAGSHLAMLEGEIALNTLLCRLPNVRLADKELEWHHNAGFRGLQKLELVWDAVR